MWKKSLKDLDFFNQLIILHRIYLLRRWLAINWGLWDKIQGRKAHKHLKIYSPQKKKKKIYNIPIKCEQLKNMVGNLDYLNNQILSILLVNCPVKVVT